MDIHNFFKPTKTKQVQKSIFNNQRQKTGIKAVAVEKNSVNSVCLQWRKNTVSFLNTIPE